MSATVILAKMEELAPTVMEVIHANVKMGGQALIVNKVRLSIHTSPKYWWNKQPKGIKWSAVPLLCSTFSLVFIGGGRAEWGDFLSVRPSVHSPICAIQPGLRPSQPYLKPEAWLTGCLGLRSGWLGLKPGWLGFRTGWLGLRPGWMAQRGGWTYGWTDGRT